LLFSPDLGRLNVAVNIDDFQPDDVLRGMNRLQQHQLLASKALEVLQLLKASDIGAQPFIIGTGGKSTSSSQNQTPVASSSSTNVNSSSRNREPPRQPSATPVDLDQMKQLVDEMCMPLSVESPQFDVFDFRNG
jgi:hypothetical protein